MTGDTIQDKSYLDFAGQLVFVDTVGQGNPIYQTLGSQFPLLYLPGDGTPNLEVPLQATPAQTLSLILGNQNCTLTLYEKPIDTQQDFLAPNPHYVEPGYWDDYSI